MGADLDRDGQIELVVGAPGLFAEVYSAAYEGNVYLLEGPSGAAPIRAWNGAETGIPAAGFFVGLGLEVAAGGDTDGDGYGEAMFTSKWTSTHPQFGPQQGIYVLRDLDTPLASAIVLEEEPGWRITDMTFSDIDGDGVDEVLAISDSESTDGNSRFTQVHVPLTGRLALHEQDTLEFPDDSIGIEYLAADDFDGDGQADVLLSRSDGSARLGSTYGCSSPSWTGIADGEAVCTDRWDGEHLDSHAGMGLARGGDLDGDGRPDALVGSIFYDAAVSNAGRAYVLNEPLGQGVRSLADAWAHLTGEVVDDLVGLALHGPGDLDGDGHDDVLLGPPAPPPRPTVQAGST